MLGSEGLGATAGGAWSISAARDTAGTRQRRNLEVFMLIIGMFCEGSQRVDERSSLRAHYWTENRSRVREP
jgi:hypothetical protein